MGCHFMVWFMLRILGMCRNPSNIVRQSNIQLLDKCKIHMLQWWVMMVSAKHHFTDSSAMVEGMSGYKLRLA